MTPLDALGYVFGCLIGVGILSAVGHFHPHFHKYMPIACELARMLDHRGYVDVTVIVKKCPCGKIKTYRIDGLWTAEDLGIKAEA